MCAPLFALWVGRNKNGPIEERTSVVKGSNVNTRVVKLLPLNKKEDPGVQNRGKPDAKTSDVEDRGANAEGDALK